MFNFANEIKFKQDPMGQFNSQVNKNGNESTKAIGFLMKKSYVIIPLKVSFVKNQFEGTKKNSLDSDQGHIQAVY